MVWRYVNGAVRGPRPILHCEVEGFRVLEGKRAKRKGIVERKSKRKRRRGHAKVWDCDGVVFYFLFFFWFW